MNEKIYTVNEIRWRDDAALLLLICNAWGVEFGHKLEVWGELSPLGEKKETFKLRMIGIH